MGKKLVVIGLDGLSFSLARYLVAEGIWSNVGKYLDLEQGTSFSSEIPYLSPVNWTSFFTGKGPEEHGVFGFTEFNKEKGELFFSDFTHVQSPTIFEVLGQKGYFLKVLNLPHTYPARPLRGQLVAGFLALDLQKAVFPPMLYPLLKQRGYVLEGETIKALQGPALIFPEIEKSLLARQRAFELLWADLSWDLFIVVITELDRLFHFCYPYLFSSHPLQERMLLFLKKVDAFLGLILERYFALAGKDKRLMLVADHGFTELKVEVDLNAFLAQQGFLTWARQARNEWDVQSIAKDSKALALDSGRIYLYPFSKVKDFSLGLKLKEVLLQLEYKGEKVFSTIFLKEELYPRANFEHTPDLVCIPASGFELKGKFDRREIFGHFGRRGAHREEDVFFWDSWGFKPRRTRDVGQEILHYFEGSILV